MDVPSGFRQQPEKYIPLIRNPIAAQGGQKRNRAPRGQKNPQLFDDTSTQQNYGQNMMNQNYGQQQGFDLSENGQEADLDSEGFPPSGGYGAPGAPDPGFMGQQYMNDPMANMAVQYGTNLAGQGKDLVHKNIEKYVSTSKLKYYFAVDTAYVGKKLGLLIFPFTHSDWSIKYNQDEPVAPRYELNAPDLYIPVMAFVTYVLVAGVVLGTQERFTPEQLGIQASSALVWLVIEILAILLSLYLMNVQTDLKYLDLMAYSGYKYVGMILSLLSGLMFQAVGYYATLAWTSITLAFFLVRTLKIQIVPQSDPDNYTRGSKRRLYLLLFVAGIQPLFMWWLTHHLIST